MAAKLTIEQADEIRRRAREEGATQMGLAAEYGVCQSTIGRVIHGQRSGAPRNRPGEVTLEPAQVRRLVDAIRDGVSKSDCIERFGVHSQRLDYYLEQAGAS